VLPLIVLELDEPPLLLEDELGDELDPEELPPPV
jgi:hypothetical protein